MNTVLFKLSSMPHRCSHQPDRFPFHISEQGTLYFVFQEIIWNLIISYHLSSSTLSKPLALFLLSCFQSL